MASAHQQHLAHLAHAAHQAHANRGNANGPWEGIQNPGVYDPFGLWGPSGQQEEHPYPAGPDILYNAQTSNDWHNDPNLGKISGAMAGMMQGPNSLLRGPGQAFNPAQLGGLYAQGMGAISRNQREGTAGAAAAAASRGGAGVSPSLIYGPMAQAQSRGALATGDLDAQMKGYDLGLNQYTQRQNLFSNLMSGASAEANRRSDQQQSDFNAKQAYLKFLQQNQMDQNNNMFSFANQHAQELAAPPAGVKNGKDIMMNERNIFSGLQNLRNQATVNLNRFTL